MGPLEAGRGKAEQRGGMFAAAINQQPRGAGAGIKYAGSLWRGRHAARERWPRTLTANGVGHQMPP